MRTQTRLALRMTFAAMTALALTQTLIPTVQAAVTTQMHYRLGEDEGGVAGAAGAANTMGRVGVSLPRLGAPVYTAGVTSTSVGMQFNGTNTGYRAAGIPAGMNVTTNFGIEAWVKGGGTVGTSAIAYIGHSSLSGFGLYRSGANYVGIMGGLIFLGAAPVSTGWTHLALVRAGTTTTFYANGVAIATSATGPNLPSSGGGTVGTSIGTRANSVSAIEVFSGAVDEVRGFTFAPGAFELADLGAGRLSVSTSTNGSVQGIADGGSGTISCGATCAAAYPAGASVELTASPAGGSSFLGWGGACSGTASCVVSIAGAQNVSASFSLIEQTILFATLPNMTLPAGAVALSARASSNLPVSFASLSPTVCTVTGSTATLTGTPGRCLVRASQEGSTSFNSASTTQSFFVTPVGVSSAPQNLVCTPGAAEITCRFTAPAQSGASDVTGYALTCVSEEGTTVNVSGAQSPLTVRGLPAGRAASCTITATNSRGSSVPANPASATPLSRVVRQGGIDINGDGIGEVLLRINNASAQLGTYDAASRQIRFRNAPDPGPGVRLLGIGDFGARGRSDLLMQDIASGETRLWVNFDGFVDNLRYLRVVKPGWVVEAVADMDGDGRSDIVWRYVGSPLNPPANPNDVGVVFVWYMNDGVVSEVKARGGAPLGWTVLGAADLRGNGLADMVWVSPTGQIRSATSNADRSFTNQLVGQTPAGYTATRLADFDGDGKADILFRNAQGKLKLWRMDGINIAASIDLPDSDPTWELYAIADLNGDGTVDLVFRTPDNTLVVWLMNAATPASPTVIENAGTAPVGAVAVEP